MNSELCLAPALRLDLSERLPSLSEYLCDDLPTPQLREDNEGNLIVQLGNDCASRTDHVLSGYGSGLEPERNRGQEPGNSSRTWTFLQPKPVYPAPSATQSNGGYRTKAEVSDSFGFSTLDPHPVSWDQFPVQIDSNFGFPSASSSSSSSSTSSSFLQMSNVDATSSVRRIVGRDVSAVTWSGGAFERESGVTSSSSSPPSRKRAFLDSNLDDAEARKLELKRAKNREAAQRCQQRKQERIGRLETKVGRLKEQNVSLEHTVTGLRDQIVWLQRQIVTHANNGCHITLPRFTPTMRHQHPV